VAKGARSVRANGRRNSHCAPTAPGNSLCTPTSPVKSLVFAARTSQGCQLSFSIRMASALKCSNRS
jgi:hypothetical protein